MGVGGSGNIILGAAYTTGVSRWILVLVAVARKDRNLDVYWKVQGGQTELKKWYTFGRGDEVLWEAWISSRNGDTIFSISEERGGNRSNEDFESFQREIFHESDSAVRTVPNLVDDTVAVVKNVADVINWIDW
jgi:hypothetical protein